MDFDCIPYNSKSYCNLSVNIQTHEYYRTNLISLNYYIRIQTAWINVANEPGRVAMRLPVLRVHTNISKVSNVPQHTTSSVHAMQLSCFSELEVVCESDGEYITRNVWYLLRIEVRWFVMVACSCYLQVGKPSFRTDFQMFVCDTENF